jgi:hypothetical protein
VPGACVGRRTAGASKDKPFPGAPYRSRNRNPMIKTRGDESVKQSRPVKTPSHTTTPIMLGQLQPLGSYIPVHEIRSKLTGLRTCKDALRQFRMRQKLVRWTFAHARRRWSLGRSQGANRPQSATQARGKSRQAHHETERIAADPPPWR